MGKAEAWILASYLHFTSEQAAAGSGQDRNRERIEAKGSARGSKGWLPSAEITLTTHGMAECWTDTQAVRAVLPAEWKAKCAQAVDKNSNQYRQEKMIGMTSAIAYNPIKCPRNLP